MNMTHYFLLFWILTKCRSDQMFVNFPWRKNFLKEHEKSWFGYPLEIVKHLMGKVALDFRKELKYAKQYVYHFLKSVKNVLENTCERNIFQHMNTRNHKNMMVRPPLGRLAMDTWNDHYTKHRINCAWTDFFDLPGQRSYAWLFQLDSNLRLNLSFLTFFIKDVFTYCGWGMMHLRDILPTGTESFILCGKHPEFTHYSSSSSVLLEIQYEITLPVEIYVLFSVFAKNIVSRMQRRSVIPITNQEIKSYDILHMLCMY